jgi:hydroxymethylglutaryl-CoA synthase
MSIGIDHMAVYVPAQYLDASDLAAARDVDPAKFSVGIGISQIAVPPQDEDVVVLAANAGLAALQEAGVAPADVGLLVVGTESAVDNSKPTATHVHEMLGVGPRCRVYDVMHACAGGTYGVLSALDWLAASDSRRYALVIASDIARYGRKTLGEPTQGAAAVAMLLSRAPRLMGLSELATYSRSVYDFWKPLQAPYPIVDGLLSVQCYMEASQACFAGQELSPDAAFVYHTPYPKLVQQTHSRTARLLGQGADAAAHLARAVTPGTAVVSRIGNTYAASLWLALYGLLETTRHSGTGFDGCYLFSYGSGCGAALLRGTFGPDTSAQVAKFGLLPRLDGRRRMAFAEYDALMDAHESAQPPEQLPVGATGAFRFAGSRDNKRVYERNPAAH